MAHPSASIQVVTPNPFLDDLAFALVANLRVTVRLRSGQVLNHLEVREVDRPNFQVVVATPMVFGDNTSRTRLNIGDFSAVQVTDVPV